MADTVGSVRVQVELDDSGVVTGIRRVEARVKESVRSMDHLTANPRIDVDSLSAEEKIKVLDAALRDLDHQVANVQVDADTKPFERARARVMLQKKALERNVKFEVKMDKDRGFMGSIRQIGDVLAGGEGTFDKWRKEIGKTRVSMGFFSATLKGVAGIAITMGPILEALAASAVAVAGSLGAALAGAAGLGSAALAGFGQAGLGAMLVLKPMAKQIHNVILAQTQYNAAVDRYGKNSAEAKNKQQQLNSELAHLPPQMRAAVKTVGQLGGEFKKLTAPSRGQVFKTFSEGIKSVKADMPGFAHATNQAFASVGKALRSTFKDFRSPEIQRAFAQIGTNFAAFIGPAIHGLGQLAQAWVKISASFSRFLPGVGQGFDAWAANINKATGNTHGLNSTVDTLMSHFRAWAALLGATGGLLAAIFGAGAPSGKGLVKDLTQIVSKWTQWINSHPKQVQQFFQSAAKTTKLLASDLAKLVVLAHQFLQATTPIAQGFLKGLGAIGKVINKMSQIPGFKSAFLVLGGAFAAIWSLSKIISVVKKIQEIKRILGAMKVSQALGALMGLPGFGRTKGPVQTTIPGLNTKNAEKDAQQSTSRLGRIWASMKGIVSGALGSAMVAGRAAMARGIAALPSIITKAGPILAAAWAITVTPGLKQINHSIEQFANAVGGGINKTIGNAAKSIAGSFRNTPGDIHKPIQRGVDTAARAIAGLGSRSQAVSGILSKFGVRFPAGQLAGKIGAAGAAFQKLRAFGVNALANLASRPRVVGRAVAQFIHNPVAGAINLVRTLGRQRVPTKIQRFVEHGFHDVAGKLGKILGIKLKPKTQQTVEKGSKAVFTALARVLGFKLPRKTQNINEQGGSGVLNTLQRISGFHLPSVTQVITTIHRFITTHHAEGGIVEGMPAGAYPRRTHGERVASATFLTGEENRPEYVIATNPAYRDKNVGLLRAVAGEFGLMVVKAFAGGGYTGALPYTGLHVDTDAVPTIRPHRHTAPAPSSLMGPFNIEQRLIDRMTNVQQQARRSYDQTVNRRDQLGYVATPGTTEAQQRIAWLKNLISGGTVAGTSAYGIESIIWELDYFANQLNTRILKQFDRAARIKPRKKRGGESRSEYNDYKQNLQEALQGLLGYRGDVAKSQQQLNLSIKDSLQDAFDINSEVLGLGGTEYKSAVIPASGITGGPGGVGGGGGGEPPITAAEAASFQQQRYGLLTSFLQGGFSPIGSAFGGMAGFSPAVSAYNAPGGSSGGGGGGAGGGATINNYWSAPPPDPHTWAKQQAFEAMAAF